MILPQLFFSCVFICLPSVSLTLAEFGAAASRLTPASSCFSLSALCETQIWPHIFKAKECEGIKILALKAYSFREAGYFCLYNCWALIGHVCDLKSRHPWTAQSKRESRGDFTFECFAYPLWATRSFQNLNMSKKNCIVTVFCKCCLFFP